MTHLPAWLRTPRVGIHLHSWPASAHTWSEALEDVRWGVGLWIAYTVTAALVCLLVSVGELGGTAERWSGLPERVPWWHRSE